MNAKCREAYHRSLAAFLCKKRRYKEEWRREIRYIERRGVRILGWEQPEKSQICALLSAGVSEGKRVQNFSRQWPQSMATHTHNLHLSLFTLQMYVWSLCTRKGRRWLFKECQTIRGNGSPAQNTRRQAPPTPVQRIFQFSSSIYQNTTIFAYSLFKTIVLLIFRHIRANMFQISTKVKWVVICLLANKSVLVLWQSSGFQTRQKLFEVKDWPSRNTE